MIPILLKIQKTPFVTWFLPPKPIKPNSNTHAHNSSDTDPPLIYTYIQPESLKSLQLSSSLLPPIGNTPFWIRLFVIASFLGARPNYVHAMPARRLWNHLWIHSQHICSKHSSASTGGLEICAAESKKNEWNSNTWGSITRWERRFESRGELCMFIVWYCCELFELFQLFS